MRNFNGDLRTHPVAFNEEEKCLACALPKATMTLPVRSKPDNDQHRGAPQVVRKSILARRQGQSIDLSAIPIGNTGDFSPTQIDCRTLNLMPWQQCAAASACQCAMARLLNAQLLGLRPAQPVHLSPASGFLRRCVLHTHLLYCVPCSQHSPFADHADELWMACAVWLDDS